MPLEWHLSEPESGLTDHQYDNIRPRSVFLLALAASFVAVSGVYLCYEGVNAAIAYNIVPPPPALQQYVN